MRNFRDLIEKKMENKEFIDEKDKSILSDVMSEFKPKGGMADKLGKMQKVTVAADDTESLEEGLDTAKEIVDEMPMEGMEETPLTPEEIEAKISELEMQIEDLRSQLPQQEELPMTEEGEVYGEDYGMEDEEYDY